MKVRQVKSLHFILLFAVFGLLFLPDCGVLDVGIESTPTIAMASPVSTSTVPIPTQTHFPGKLKPGQPLKIIQIQMLSPTDGWAVGQVETDLNDHIMFTQDGGQTWQERTPPEALLGSPPSGLSATAHFGADGFAWVTYVNQMPQQSVPARQQIWHTADAGVTWQASVMYLSGLQAEYFVPSNLGFIDEQHGWMMAHLGAGMNHDYIAIFTSADGGGTWQRVTDPENTPELMGCAKTGLAFSTPNNGWLTGNCPGLQENLFFYNTFDGGKTWQKMQVLPPNNQPAELFSKGKAGCGIPRLIYVSARSIMLNVRCAFYDSNKTVSWLYAGEDNHLPDARYVPTPYGSFSFINAEEGWLVGAWLDDPVAPGEIYHSIDGGASWKLVISTAWQGIPDFVDANNGWVIAHSADKSALVFSADGGKTWKDLAPQVTR